MEWQEEWWFLRERLGGPSSRRAVRNETSKLLMAHFAVEGTAQFGAMCFSNVFYWIVFQLNVFRWSVFQCSGFWRRPRCPALPAASFPPLIAPALHQSNPIQCSAFHKSNATQGFTPIQPSTSHQSSTFHQSNPIQSSALHQSNTAGYSITCTSLHLFSHLIFLWLWFAIVTSLCLIAILLFSTSKVERYSPRCPPALLQHYAGYPAPRWLLSAQHSHGRVV